MELRTGDIYLNLLKSATDSDIRKMTFFPSEHGSIQVKEKDKAIPVTGRGGP
jgi:hypothetical protein